MFEYLNENNTTNIIGSFTRDKNSDYKAGIKAVYESFGANYDLDLWDDTVRILKNDTLRESYKQELLGEVLEESFQDAWYDMHKDKLEQLFENTAMEIVAESQMGQMNPIVGFSLPILKKNYFDNIAKDIIMTEVPDKPFIKIAFERGFLKGEDGKKYYIPDCFYDNSYKEVYKQAKGINIYDFYTSGSYATKPGIDITNGVMDKKIVSEVTSDEHYMAKRQALALDFCIQDLVVHARAKKKGQETYEQVEVVIKSANIQPDYAAGGSFHYKLDCVITDKVTPVAGGDAIEIEPLVLKDYLFGQVDSYWGYLTASSTAPEKAAGASGEEVTTGKIVRVVPGGHLANENNERTVELDYERETVDYKIEDGERLNTGLTLEKIRDNKALLNIDITSKIITDMTTVLTNFEDNNMLDFLDNSFNIWRTKTDLPFDYGNHIANGKFVEEATFSCAPPTTTTVTQSQYIDSELKFNLDRLIDQLKVKLNNKDCMFVLYAHPNNITLLNNNVKWVVDEDTKVGGVQLDYRFGVLTNSKTRVHVISSQKVPQRIGLRLVAQPLTQEIITFKHYKYSLNIENSYRNPLTPLTPNVMATQRYKTVELLPVQGQFELINNGFGLKDRDMYAGRKTEGEVVYPR